MLGGGRFFPVMFMFWVVSMPSSLVLCLAGLESDGPAIQASGFAFLFGSSFLFLFLGSDCSWI